MSTSRCPSCGAAVRPAAPWCLLCHRDLRPAPQPEPVVEPVVIAERVPIAQVLAAPAASTGRHALEHAPAWPCAACGAANSFAATLCGNCGSGFLASLGAERGPDLRLPLVGSLTRFGRSARLGIAIAIGLLGALVISGLLALLGRLLG